MDVIDWLIDADPSIHWQVLRDLVHAPADEVAAVRARVATEGWVLASSRCRARTGSGTTAPTGPATPIRPSWNADFSGA